MEPDLNALDYLMQVNPEIELLNFYKSCPVSIKAVIVAVESGGFVKVKVFPPGSVCLYQNKTTVLLSTTLTEVIRAKIKRFDIVDGIVSLHDFSYLSAWTGQRMVVRVQPDQAIEIILRNENRVIHGLVADISLNGIGVLVDNPDLEDNEVIQVFLSLPTGETVVRGMVVETIPQDGMYRIGIKFVSNSRDISFLLKYITSRRLEILDEVSLLYERVYQTAKA
jgi:hypothetical protein